MTEIRCPMCGKANSPEREECEFCQARLKPLLADPTEEEESDIQSGEPFPLGVDSGGESEIPDWLSELRQEGTVPGDELGEGFQEEMDDSPAFSSFEQDEETPDWLTELRGESDSGAPSLEGDSVPVLDSPLDATEEVQFPEWLEDTHSVNDVPEDTDKAVEEEPDWLLRVRHRRGEDERGQSQPFQEAEEDVVMPGDETVAFGYEEPAGERLSQEADWMSEVVEEISSAVDVDDETDFTQETAVSPAKPIETPDVVPDRLSDQREEVSIEDKTEIVSGRLPDDAGAQEAPEDSTPDWLTDLPPVKTSESPIEQDVAAGPEGIAESDGVPDWLSDLESISIEQPPDDMGVDVTPEEIEPIPFSGTQEGIAPFDFGDMQDWDKQDELVAEKPEEVESDADLTPAELPTWLEAMRPIEDAAPSVRVLDEVSDEVESAGPLEGLRGVLSAEPEAALLHKPAAFSIKLKVSKRQRAHIDLLKTILDEEGKARSIPNPSVISPQNVLRWAIAVVLFLAVLWPLVTGSQEAPMPSFPEETGEVNRIINQLPSEARVLLAFDYEPALSGEMDAAASAVVDHMMLRGVYLTLVSTSPTGPIVAERFISSTQSDHNYTSGNQYVNLGYISGGSTGLLSFSESPQRTLPRTLDNVAAWEGGFPPLQGINAVSDFSLVAVIVDNPDTARAWIEQVQPRLIGKDHQTPLVMVISAQSEPMVLPYYESHPRQVQGLVTGLRGGASYARLTGRGGLSRKYWDAFSIGTIIAALLAAIGGMANLATGALSQRGEPRSESEP